MFYQKQEKKKKKKKKEKKLKRKAKGVPQSQTAALPRLQEEEETDKIKTSANQTNMKSTKIISPFLK